MSVAVIVILSVVVCVLAFAGALLLSARRQGKLATKVFTVAMRNDTLRSKAEAKAVQALSEDPDRIDEMLAQAGASRQMRRAAEQFKAMDPAQRDAMLTAAQTGDVQAVRRAQQAAARPAGKSAAQRSKAKAARKARKRNRGR